jgi:hypothetical protein
VYPWWRLANDRIGPAHDAAVWQAVEPEGIVHRLPDKEPTIEETRQFNAAAGFDAAVHGLLIADPALVERTVTGVLVRFFPPIDHGDLREAVGLSFSPDPEILTPASNALADAGQFDPTSEVDARTITTRSIAQRQGQPEFRRALLAAYSGRCAITGCPVPDVLEAAHIMPYRGAHTNVVENGLLLRADLHTLFDLFLLGVDSTTWTVRIAPVLRRTPYDAYAGQALRLPTDTAARPSAEALALHLRKLKA